MTIQRIPTPVDLKDRVLKTAEQIKEKMLPDLSWAGYYE